MRRLFFLLALATAPTPSAAAWREASSRHFVIYSEQSENSLRDFATRLERYDAAMRFVRSLPDEDLGPANRLTVYVVSSAVQVRKLYGDKSGFIAGFYIPRAGGSVAFIPRGLGNGDTYDMNAETVLLHEYAHHFMYENYSSSAYPAWFSEGFAEFNSTAKFERNGDVGLGLPAMHRAYGLTTIQMPIQKLLDPDLRKFSNAEREALYGRGWLLTHLLMFDPARRGQLSAYIAAINSGKSALDAAWSAFGDLKKLDADLNRYLVQSKMSYLKVPSDKIRIGEIAIRPLSPGAGAAMPVRIRSDRGVDAATAKQVVQDARRAAAPFPTDVAAQVMLAEAEYDAGNHAEAEAAADRALAVDPKSVKALIYKGRAKLALASAAEASDPAAWKEVRRWLIAANRVDPDNPEPLILFYDSFQAQGLAPTANAVLGLVQAFALAPQDRDLRMRVAHQHLLDGNAKAAHAALAPIAFDPHGGGAGKAAAAILAKLDAEGAKAALEQWSQAQESEGDDSDPS